MGPGQAGPSHCGCIVGHLGCQLQDVHCQHIQALHGEGAGARKVGKVLHQDAEEHLQRRKHSDSLGQPTTGRQLGVGTS